MIVYFSKYILHIFALKYVFHLQSIFPDIIFLTYLTMQILCAIMICNKYKVGKYLPNKSEVVEVIINEKYLR